MKKWFNGYVKRFALAATVMASFFLGAGVAHASYNASDLISDPLFTSSTVMSAGDIQTFLNNENSGIRNYSDIEDCSSSPRYSSFTAFYNSHYSCGQSKSVSQIIYDVAQAYQISPRVILATLQKEQSLVTDPTAPGSNMVAINCAMGYDSCNDTVGFFHQVDWATWQFRANVELMNGRSYWNWAPSSYPCANATSLYSTGLYPGRTVTFADPGGTAETITLANSATASLYCYTPYVGPHSLTGYSGSYNFVTSYESWWGSTIFGPDSISMSNVSQPDTAPALGQTISYTVSYHNNLSDSITFDAGIVGRLGSLTGSNRDFGWQSVTLAGGATQQVTFTTSVQDLGTIYVWPAISYQGIYVHDNSHGAMLVTHVPNIGAGFSPGTSPTVGQTDNFSVNVFNNESHSITLDAAGIPIRYLNRYNYDTGWTGPVTIAAHSTIASPLTGSITYDKAGAYTEWTSIKIGNQYITISPTANVNASLPSPSPSNILLSYTVTPNTSPSLGEDVTLSFKLTSTYSVPITLDAIGVVGRYDSPFAGANRDLGWAGPITIAANGNYQKSYTTTVSDLRNFYTWVAINYQGRYIHYNNWGFMLTPHIPNLVLSVPITGQPTLNQSTPMNATIQSHEPNAIKYDAAGMPARYYDRYNYDITWAPGGTLNNNGTIALSGNALFDKPGPYTVWVSILIQGRFITIGSVKSFNIQ